MARGAGAIVKGERGGLDFRESLNIILNGITFITRLPFFFFFLKSQFCVLYTCFRQTFHRPTVFPLIEPRPLIEPPGGCVQQGRIIVVKYKIYPWAPSGSANIHCMNFKIQYTVAPYFDIVGFIADVCWFHVQGKSRVQISTVFPVQ